MNGKVVFALVLSGVVMLVIGIIVGKKMARKATAIKAEEVARDFVFADDRSFTQCHASTLVRTRDGQFVIAWFGGSHEKHDDVGIWLSRGGPGKWTRPVQVAKLRMDPHWNPVLFMNPDGQIMLYFKIGRNIDLWETWLMTSDDNGSTWSEPHELVPGDKGGRGPVKNKPVILSDGTWLAPASDEKNGKWNAFADRSDDGGKTWVAAPFVQINRDSIHGEGIIQPTIWESEPGKVHMLIRSSAGFICRSDSDDYGRTWSPVYKTSLPNPNSGIDVAKTGRGKLVLVYNNSGGNWGPRMPLSLAASRNGDDWQHLLDIEMGSKGDEFSYPSIISFGDTVAVAYTWKRQRVGFWMGVVK